MSRIGRVDRRNTASWNSGVSGGERQLTGSRAICSGVPSGEFLKQNRATVRNRGRREGRLAMAILCYVCNAIPCQDEGRGGG